MASRMLPGTAGGPVLGEGTAGLAHEPHRHPGHRQAAARPDEGGVLVAAGGGCGHHLTLSPRRGPVVAPRAPGAGRTRGPGRAYNQGFPSSREGQNGGSGGGAGRLQAEQEFVDFAYARLDAMRDDARSMRDGVLDLGRGGTFQSRTERDVIVRTSMARLEQLDIGDQALTFGRIDRAVHDGATTGGPPSDTVAPEVFHIGRLAIHDSRPRAAGGGLAGPHRRAVLPGHRARPAGPGPPPPPGPRRPAGGRVWRTSASRRSPPTRAASPGRRREGGELIVGDLPIGGPAALLAALDRARSGRMTDIVSTIQREQDEIIRSPLPGVLVVQGGPGTGKTAVALHRAAYLLYTHRFPLERQGVLVVGPNPLFLRYIEQVLPSLGETGVTLSTVSGLVPEIRVRADRAGRGGPPEGRRPHGPGGGPGGPYPAAATHRGGGHPLRGPAPPADPGRHPGDRPDGPAAPGHPQRAAAPGHPGHRPGAGRAGPPDPAVPVGGGAP